jgi:uncharacterized membrane protein YkvA (DUF1232 family)
MSVRKGGPGRGLEHVVDFIDERAPFPIGSLLLSMISIVYLMNPTAGVIELIPDVIPYIGNLDEAAAGVLLAWCLSNLARWRKIKKAQKAAKDLKKEGS